MNWSTPNEQTSKFAEVLGGHLDGVNHVAFSSDGELFATCGKDVQVIVWKASGKLHFGYSFTVNYICIYFSFLKHFMEAERSRVSYNQ